MWCLEGEVQVDNERVICLFENVCFYDSVLKLFLQYEIFLLERFQGIELSGSQMLRQEHLTKSPTSQRGYNIKTRKRNLTILCNLI